MIKKKILVVLGGNSRERQISLKTGKACIAAIKKLGHKIEIFDPKKKSFLDIKRSNSDIIFNALHGEEGEDGEGDESSDGDATESSEEQGSEEQ